MRDPDASASGLSSIVGDNYVQSQGAALLASPGDPAQIIEVLRLAQASGLVVVPSGGNTKQGWGNLVESDIQVSMRRIARLRTHVWQDMTCTVEAGMTWARMQELLRIHGQMVALDPLWPESATVGGIIATNDSGSMRLKYGGLRNLIIGMTVILADGTKAKSGGMVVKNVAGYDVHKLMTGSFGTLGIITDVNFRLHPVEELPKTWTVRSQHTDGAQIASFAAPLLALLDSQLMPSRVQLRTGKNRCELDVGLSTRPECIDECLTRLQAILPQFQIDPAQEATWSARQRLFDDGETTVLKVSVLPGDICPVSLYLQERAGELDATLSTVAQANGIISVALNTAPDAAIALISGLRAKLTRSGGSVVILQATDRLRNRIDPWGQDPAAMSLMRQIKLRFDPKRTLSPGRFVGGI
jgi:glycolate oxidase FAD binding subunit